MASSRRVSEDISLQQRRALGLVVSIITLNFFDAAATWSCLHAGLCKELNPLMQWAYDAGPAVFFGLKVLIVVPVLLCLDFVHEPWPKRLLSVVFLAYLLVSIVHIVNILLWWCV